MKNKAIAISHEEALIYRNNYKPSLNILRFFRAIAGIFIFGQSSIGSHRNYYRRK